MQTSQEFNIPFDATFAFCGHVLDNEPKESLERHIKHCSNRFLEKEAEQLGIIEYIYQGYSVNEFEGDLYKRQIENNYKKITVSATGRLKATIS